MKNNVGRNNGMNEWRKIIGSTSVSYNFNVNFFQYFKDAFD